jgi:uncharacterized membrane protein ArfB
MDFITQWLWYLMAFVVGSVIAWGTTLFTIECVSEEEALAELPDSRQIGAQS